ncbi:hypothetical protein M422DRAFT_269210 [Sphaerobolus stellatus SS14]|uniref:Uncharacterized protein n=1 Tax=Sphaerobolus stellatus (strain SS14) TaxID=990650 RepID=A0A0C9TIL6_SPHS4|nr:hypothetical protein M422DRAFT_269210 [Sphaerobolus stellatus SS14]
MLNPLPEKDIGESEFHFDRGEQEIVEHVKRDLGQIEEDKIDIDSDSNSNSNSDSEDEEALRVGNDIKMCCVMEHACLKYAQLDSSLELMQQLHIFHSHLRATAMQTVKQTMLDHFVSRAGHA